MSQPPVTPTAAGYRVLVDFDGTVAPDDPTDRLLERFADPAWQRLEDAWQAGRLNSRECMQGQAALLRVTPEALDAAISAVRLDPAFPGFVAFCHRRDIDVRIVSDGFDRVLEVALRQARLPIRFFANTLQWQGGDRWRLALPHRRRDCRSAAANCKCAHGARNDGRAVVAIGDGRSDFCMAERADYVLAKGALADFCRARGLAHAAFTSFEDATRRLAEWLDRQDGSLPATFRNRRERGRVGSRRVATSS